VNRLRMVAAGALIVAMLMIAGCSGEGTTAESEPVADLAGTSWNCYEFAVGASPQPVLSTAPITAEFSTDGTLSGSSGVNTYSTTFTTEGTTLTIAEPIAATMMAGPEDAMRQESNYLLTLPTAQSYNIRDDELILFGPADNMIARYRPAE